jgi:hypothetical protein
LIDDPKVKVRNHVTMICFASQMARTWSPIHPYVLPFTYLELDRSVNCGPYRFAPSFLSILSPSFFEVPEEKMVPTALVPFGWKNPHLHYQRKLLFLFNTWMMMFRTRSRLCW